MPRADMMTAATDNEAVVLAFYRHLMKKDFDAWTELFVEDARQENPFLPAQDGLDAGFAGRERIAFHYRTVLEKREDLVFTIDAIHQTADPRCVVVEAGGQSLVPETGRIYDQRYVWVFQLRDGRIAAMREYFNPLAFEAAFTGFLVGDGAVDN
ncbi:MAG: nuclear transport factor 2 family protein [Rhizobiaceae bacterium]|nr:nuclear transport factor 2 family protein [Rhizobiaceae bacterium]MCV0404924.1 nuclear transport factor 2 family protein [Rhizobiaceae bacterium]